MFLSYTRADRVKVFALVDDLQRLGRSTWLDQQITGGAPWWREIIERIQHAEVFLFALSADSLKSRPCQLELHYAQQLRVPIIPIQVGDVENRRIPVAGLQIVDYRIRSADVVIDLVAAIAELSAQPRSLPSPLPKPPPVPFEYLYRLAGEINVEEIPRREQGRIIGELRQELRDEEDEIARNDILSLLRQLRGRPEITELNAREIDGILTGAEALSVPPVEERATRLPGSEIWRKPPPADDSETPTVLIGPGPGGGPAPVETPVPAPAETEVPEPQESEPAATDGRPPGWMDHGGIREDEPDASGNGAAGGSHPDPAGEGGRPAWMRGMSAAELPRSEAVPPGPDDATEELGRVTGGDERGWWGEARTLSTATATDGATASDAPGTAALVTASPEPATPVGPPPKPAFPRFAFAGTALGALGIPLLVLAPVGVAGRAPAAGFVAAAMLVLAILGLATAMVSAHRGETAARPAVAVAVLGLIGVIVFTAVAGAFAG